MPSWSSSAIWTPRRYWRRSEACSVRSKPRSCPPAPKSRSSLCSPPRSASTPIVRTRRRSSRCACPVSTVGIFPRSKCWPMCWRAAGSIFTGWLRTARRWPRISRSMRCRKPASAMHRSRFRRAATPRRSSGRCARFWRRSPRTACLPNWWRRPSCRNGATLRSRKTPSPGWLRSGRMRSPYMAFVLPTKTSNGSKR